MAIAMTEIYSESVSRLVAVTKDIDGNDIRSSDGTVWPVAKVVVDLIEYKVIDGIPQPRKYVVRSSWW